MLPSTSEKMQLLFISLLLWVAQAQARAAFAHFMVGNTAKYTSGDWVDDVEKAAAAHIDAFALNMAYGDPLNDIQVPIAFAAAGSAGFQLFFSFDYAGNGSWPKAAVEAMINKYSGEAAYYHYNSKPFVSTFEGPDSATDWPDIKSNTGCFFMPSWSSLGAKAAMATGVVDGLFSWAGWPEGPNDMFTTVDASYNDFLNGLPYMMPMSPWFFTNLPNYEKNWLWRGDDIWYDRWIHAWYLAPEFLEIITWNDYGESHYIGPLRDGAFDAFDIGEAPFNYAKSFPHDGWRLFLPYVIDIYKNRQATITEEGLVTWFRPNPGNGCATGGTTGNTASQLQIMYPPSEIAQDKIFFSALLGSAAEISVSVGGVSLPATWAKVPDGGIGMYHGNVSYSGTGSVTVTISRSGSTLATVSGGSISDSCVDSISNWNAWVGSASAGAISVASPSYLANMNCTSGTGPGTLQALCAFACKYDYCPTVCTCSTVGKPITRPTATTYTGCPAAGYDVTYTGLCSFSCNYGFCPVQCTKVAIGTTCSAPAVVAPPIPSCVAGTAKDEWASVCAFTCRYGFCPNKKCVCTQASYDGNSAPAAVSGKLAYPTTSTADPYGLCGYACNRGFCPSPPCSDTSILSGTGGGAGTADSLSSQRLSSTTTQNSISLISYWTDCSPEPRCASGFVQVTTAHGKIHDADTNTWVLDGCHGGGNGYNRALCVESDVTVSSCSWVGKPAGCHDICPVGSTLLGQTSHIGGAKSGCKAGYYSSYCCNTILPLALQSSCPATNLNNMLTGGLASTNLQISSQNLQKASYLLTPMECTYEVNADLSQALAAIVPLGGAPGPVPGYWESIQGTASFQASSSYAYSSSVVGCTRTVYESTTITTVTTTSQVDCTAFPNACAHYHSVARNVPNYRVLTCPWDPIRGYRRAAKAYYNQHSPAWLAYVPNRTKDKASCQADEFPPFAFIAAGQAGTVGTPQYIRYIDRHDNGGAGNLWQWVCFGKKSSVTVQGGPIVNQVCTEITSEYRSVAAMSLAWGNVNTLVVSDDLLSANPCYITSTLTYDLGFPLYNNDPWYGASPNRGHKPYEYGLKAIPQSLLTTSTTKTKKRREKREPDVLDSLGADINEVLQFARRHKIYIPTLPADIDPESIVINEGNATRRATDAEIFEMYGVVRCKSEGCAEEMEAAGMLSSGGTLPATLTEAIHMPAATAVTATIGDSVSVAAPSATLPPSSQATASLSLHAGAGSGHYHGHHGHQHHHLSHDAITARPMVTEASTRKQV